MNCICSHRDPSIFQNLLYCQASNPAASRHVTIIAKKFCASIFFIFRRQCITAILTLSICSHCQESFKCQIKRAMATSQSRVAGWRGGGLTPQEDLHVRKENRIIHMNKFIMFGMIVNNYIQYIPYK